MPNHIHFIIILNSTNPVEICHGKSLQQNERKFGKQLKDSISTIINQYKGAVTRWSKKNDYTDFKWQKLFYDRIIRNEKELYQIRKYIQQNPIKFELDNGLDNLDI